MSSPAPSVSVLPPVYERERERERQCYRRTTDRRCGRNVSRPSTSLICVQIHMVAWNSVCAVLFMPATEVPISYNSCFTCLQTNCVKALVSCNSCLSFRETHLFKGPLPPPQELNNAGIFFPSSVILPSCPTS